MKLNKLILWGGLFSLLIFGGGFITYTSGDFFLVSKNMEIFGEVYTEINKLYVDEPNPTELMRTGVDAMLESLDPYTNFYSESQVEESKLIQTGQYSNIGAEIGRRGDKIIITRLYKDGPADKAGMKVGDHILKIDREAIEGKLKNIESVNNLLSGENESMVMVTVARSANYEVKEITVKRGRTEEQQENVPYFGMVNDSVGYILLSQFVQDAGKEVGDATAKLKKDAPGLVGIVLDLRGNPGGRLDEAVNVSNVFIPQQELIVEMKGRTRQSQGTFYTRRPPVDTDIRLAVLINGSSASASEIVSGSIQDLDRGVVVGRRSFGKGLVQNVRQLKLDTQSKETMALKVTVAKYYTPSGRCIQAIDYSHRNPDGSVGKVPKELVKEFATRNGRPVFDGGGVDPDISVDLPTPKPVIRALQEKSLIFDFATQYALKEAEIPSPREFQVKEDLFQQFLTYADEQGFSFETKSEKELNILMEMLDTEKYKDELEEQVETLKNKLETRKKEDMRVYKNEIMSLLKKELINRYHYKEGVLEASFDDDPDILAAAKILADKEKYRGILSAVQ